jgi:hypothetical protein
VKLIAYIQIVLRIKIRGALKLSTPLSNGVLEKEEFILSFNNTGNVRTMSR